jgi:DNA mismatch endonuclease (patch repair protein)
MTDILTPDERSRVMSKIRGKNTRIERIVRSQLHKKGLRFRLHGAELPGQPDIMPPRYQAVIFVHGCFWHGHPGCGASSLPSTRTEFRTSKIAETRNRDGKKNEELTALGWRIAVIWQCALKNRSSLTSTIERLAGWIFSCEERFEAPSPDHESLAAR